MASGEVVCESFKVKRSKDYFDKKRPGSTADSQCDLASMVSADSTTNLSSLGGSCVDLAGLDISEEGSVKGKGKATAKGKPKK